MRLTELPGGPIDHHWTKSLTLSPDRTLLYATVGSNSNITENGMEAEKNRAAVWEAGLRTSEPVPVVMLGCTGVRERRVEGG